MTFTFLASFVTFCYMSSLRIMEGVDPTGTRLTVVHFHNYESTVATALNTGRHTHNAMNTTLSTYYANTSSLTLLLNEIDALLMSNECLPRLLCCL